MQIDPFKKLEDTTEKLEGYLKKRSEGVFTRYPVLFSLLATFGFVSVLYGFERLIDSIPIFSENPLTLLFTGVFILLLTGSLYKKLS
jgi:hypothetical protein